MGLFSGCDGTALAYHRTGDGHPLICLPGGPMQASAYLGDLGGLAARHPLVLLDLRGTGGSAVPEDPASYRCDRQVDDVEALRAHLGLDRIDLLGHSAGANLAVSYAARYPDRIDRLVLVTPSPWGAGLQVTEADRRRAAQGRRAEPWYPDAFAALERIFADEATDQDWAAINPFLYGRWDPAAAAHAAARSAQTNDAAAGIFGSPGAFDPRRIRGVLSTLDVPVLLVAGEHDLQLPTRLAAGYAGLFPRADLAIQPGGAHFPWLDAPEWFVKTVTAFVLSGAKSPPLP
jgi:pimeloyl-ACP methyl ester carboxylesterase